MNNLPASIAALSFISFGIMLPVQSEMGPAVTPEQPQMVLTGESFDGWCRSKYKDCKIRIDANHIVLDNKYKVSKQQITSWSRNDQFRDASGIIGPHHLYTYEFRYKNADGHYERGWIIFQNSKASDSFYASLKKWAASKEDICQYNFDSRKVVCN